MVGLVIVSHSRALAQALADLVAQVSTTKIRMAFAGGVGPERDEFGTDALEIMEAIQSVYSEDGVLVLMDLGSAILSAEMALELLPPEMAANIRFCAAPIVEGAIAAGVQAGLGSDLETVCAEARSALLPKIEHISGSEANAMPVGGEEPLDAADAEEVVVTLLNLHGLHARPAAQFVQKAGSFDAQIMVQNLTTGKGPVSAKSLNALATLGAVEDHQISIRASGPEAKQALAALAALVEDAFGETPAAELSAASAAPAVAEAPPAAGAERAVPISEGAAMGPLFRYQAQLPPIPQELAEDPQAEWDALEDALASTRKQIRQRKNALAASVGKAESAIFDAHLLILDDPDLLEQVRAAVFEAHQNAAAAWDVSIRQVAASYRALDDPYLKARATDVMDVGNQVLFALAGTQEAPAVDLDEPVILFAEELTPTETAQLDMSKILAIMTVTGGPTSHSAILSRALGIPAVSGASVGYASLEDGILFALDGFTGDVWVNPDADIQTQIEEKRQAWLDKRAELLKDSHAQGITKDGTRVEVVANVGNAVDAKAALENGAEGVGLLRTEFLYLTRETPPTEDEQVASLVEIAAALAADGKQDRPIVVRTLDVGGDKGLPYIDMPAEENPFLGVRAIRLSLRRRELFMPQLRAILRAGEGYNFKIMFPMVANLSEVLAARQLLEEAHLALDKEGLAHQWPVETGIMIEVPAAAMLADVIAPHVDFFSVGTNDLTQYTMAAERGNPDLAELADATHPAVLRLIGQVVAAAHANDSWVGVCGELAGDPAGSALLVGLGVDELSMNASAIPQAKAVLRASDLDELQALSKEALQAPGAPQVRELAGKFLEGRV